MKAFSLEEYLKNPARKVVTREGSKARIICTNANSEHPIIALVERYDYEETFTYTKDGCYFSIGSPNRLDLFFAPEKHERWINIYRDTTGVSSGAVLYDSQEEAEEIGKSYPHYAATAKIEWEE